MNYKISRPPLIQIRTEEFYNKILQESDFKHVLAQAALIVYEQDFKLNKVQIQSLNRQWRVFYSKLKIAIQYNLKYLPELRVEQCVRCGWIYIYDPKKSLFHNSCGNKNCFKSNPAKFGDNTSFPQYIKKYLYGNLYKKDLINWSDPDVRIALFMFPYYKFNDTKWYWRVIKSNPKYSKLLIVWQKIGCEVWNKTIVYHKKNKWTKYLTIKKPANSK